MSFHTFIPKFNTLSTSLLYFFFTSSKKKSGHWKCHLRIFRKYPPFQTILNVGKQETRSVSRVDDLRTQTPIFQNIKHFKQVHCFAKTPFCSFLSPLSCNLTFKQTWQVRVKFCMNCLGLLSEVNDQNTFIIHF